MILANLKPHFFVTKAGFFLILFFLVMSIALIFACILIDKKK